MASLGELLRERKRRSGGRINPRMPSCSLYQCCILYLFCSSNNKNVKNKYNIIKTFILVQSLQSLVLLTGMPSYSIHCFGEMNSAVWSNSEGPAPHLQFWQLSHQQDLTTVPASKTENLEQRCKYTTSVDIQKCAIKKTIRSCRITCKRSESALESGE